MLNTNAIISDVILLLLPRGRGKGEVETNLVQCPSRRSALLDEFLSQLLFPVIFCSPSKTWKRESTEQIIDQANNVPDIYDAIGIGIP